MKLTNRKIYEYALMLAEAFKDNEQKLPIKINFYLQKNKATLIELGQGIEQAREELIQAHGERTEDGSQYVIPKEKISIVQSELEDLLNLEQDVNIYTVSIDSLNNDLMLSTAQMEALMFMIE